MQAPLINTAKGAPSGLSSGSTLAVADVVIPDSEADEEEAPAILKEVLPRSASLRSTDCFQVNLLGARYTFVKCGG